MRLAAVLLLLAGCDGKKTLGDRCDVDKDCFDGLRCCPTFTGQSTCVDLGTDGGTCPVS